MKNTWQMPDANSYPLLRLIGLILVFVLGLLMRMSAVELSEMDTPLRSDAVDYFGYAHNLANDHGYSRTLPGINAQPGTEPVVDFLRPPGFPFFARWFYSDNVAEFVSSTLTAQLWVNMLVLLPVMFLGWTYAGYWPTFILTALYSTSPQIINMNLYFLTESLMISLMVAFVSLMFVVLRGGHLLWWILAGIILGYSAITRSYMQYFIVFLLPFLLWLCFRVDRQRYALSRIAVMTLCFLLVSGSWSYYKQAKGNLLADEIMVLTMHHGHYPGLVYNDNPATYGFPYRFDPRTDEISKDMSSVLAEIGRRFKTEPAKHLQWYLIDKPLTLWSWGFIQGDREIFIYPVISSPWDYLGHFKLAHLLHKLFYYPLVLMAVIMAIAIWASATVQRHLPEHVVYLQFISLLLMFGTGIHMVGAPFPRYHMPQLFMMYILAIAMFSVIWKAWHKGEESLPEVEDEAKNEAGIAAKAGSIEPSAS